jgi:GntR family transcriptional regulator / MocR family aminotransferase
VDETSQPIELLLSVARDGPGTLGAQIEEQLRVAIRDGSLHAGARMPSTRDLARQLGVSRRVVVDAYAQLGAEGYLSLRQGARPRVADGAAAVAATAVEELRPARPPRFDFRPSVPDVSTFPRTAWLRSVRHAVTGIADADLGYGDATGVDALRTALAEYLGRVRGVVAEPARLVVTSGYTQGLGIVCHTLAARGARRIGLEDPGDPEARDIAVRAGLDAVPIPVDDDGVRVDALAAADPDAVILTPAHQHPTGVVLGGERRTALLAWLRDRDALAIEDDYDAEYRYDRAAVGALQGLEPERIVYAGTASKTLAPALRLGWFVVPAALLDGVRREKLLADRGSARIEQLAFADFLTRGELDRHLRRMRARYRARRDTLVEAFAEALPEATVRGIAAGLHATVELPAGCDEAAVMAEAARRRIAFETVSAYRLGAEPAAGPPMLMLGYAKLHESAIRAGVREIADVVRSARVAALT